MNKEVKIREPRYKQISLDIASRIVNGQFKEGSKIYGRSTLAGEYHVSPETIRRAIILLEDMSVVKASGGSGVTIISMKNAQLYIESYQSTDSIASLKEKVIELTEKKKEIEDEIMDTIEKIIDYSNRLKNTNPLTPVEIKIEDYSHLIGKTVEESKFWQKTGATIIGIRRGQEVILSPGPYMEFNKGDTVLAVGGTDIIERAREFMKQDLFTT
ncbi:MAG: TrkA C-terminal domain-containing protein [Clostridiaceae bacterium]